MIRTSTLSCLLFVILANLAISARAQSVNVDDSLALVDLYNTTSGPQWASNANWLSGPVSSWSGITVTDGRVTKIDMAFNNLSGTLPASITTLDHLQYLDLSFNELTGNIPADIGNLSDLTDLNLSANYFSGVIPASTTTLTNLKTLYLNFNELSGSIPSNIGNLKNLVTLQLEFNQLSDTIPASINELPNVTGIYLSHNQLTGHLPVVANDLNLVNLYLDHNELTGTILNYFSKGNKLLTVNLSYNLLCETNNTAFPNSRPKTNGYADISYNKNTFDGLEFIATKMPQVFYNPQRTIPLHQHGNTLSVYAGGTLSNNTYKWIKVGKAGSTTIAGDSTFTPTESGKYYVQVKNSIAVRLTLSSDTINFTLNNLIATNKKTTAANNMETKGLQVYPNPASNIVNVKTGSKATVVLTNASGAVILTKSISSNATINVSALPNGIYYIKNKATGDVQKIIVQH